MPRKVWGSQLLCSRVTGHLAPSTSFPSESARPVGCAVRFFFPRNEWRYQICK